MTTNTTSQRRYDLDWLRVILIGFVFIFHSGRFFDTGGWHVKNAETFFSVQVWTTFLANWMMPAIFVVSGASLFFAMKGSNGKFIKDKVLRLLVPLVVGAFTHVAVQVYLERVTHHQFIGTFFDFLPHYFDGLYGFGGNFAWMGLHLWYLLVLFVFSIVLLPLFRLLKGRGAKALNKLGNVLSLPLAVYTLAIPIALLMVNLSPRTPLGSRDMGGWPLPTYMLFFIYGFIVISHPGLQERIKQQRWLSLGLGVIGIAVLFVIWGAQGDPYFGSTRFAQIFTVFGLSSWCWVLAIFGFGMKHLTRNSKYLAPLNEAVLPFYVLHQSILIVVGYFVVQWDISAELKWLIIAPMSFAIIVGLIGIIRRVNVLRFLFGMKPLHRSAHAASAVMPAPQQ
ncbi:MAG: acyltransferase family protein [Chloroflexi bacterium]|nr:acyltransferase family protein [Chloroflexota bacterium]